MRSVYNDFIDSDFKYFAGLIITNYSYTGLFPRIATAFWLKLGSIKVTLKKKNITFFKPVSIMNWFIGTVFFCLEN